MLFDTPLTLPLRASVPSPIAAASGLPLANPIADQVPSKVVSLASLLVRHRIEVLRQFSGASGRVTAGQAVCNTCLWEGPLRAGGSTRLLDGDAAGHARTTTSRWSGDFDGK